MRTRMIEVRSIAAFRPWSIQSDRFAHGVVSSGTNILALSRPPVVVDECGCSSSSFWTDETGCSRLRVLAPVLRRGFPQEVAS